MGVKTLLNKLSVGRLLIVASLCTSGQLHAAETILVSPMLDTRWSQWNHFNEMAPTDPSPGLGYDGKAPVGCMPVAGAQLAAFHAWPPVGTSSHTDNDSNGGNLISGNFTGSFNHRIPWNNMQDSYDPWGSEPQSAVDAVSELMYDLGVVLNLDFGSYDSGGSQCSLQSLSRGLNRCFFFERGGYVERPGNESNFDSQLRDSILGSRPVVVSIPGHSAIVDGLKDVDGEDYYHLNYGLGGQDDGWYQISSVKDGPVQAAIFDQRPCLVPLLDETGYATNVSGHVTLDWSVASDRLPEVSKYRIREGSFTFMDFQDGFGTMNNWYDYSGSWFVDSPGYDSGTCLRIDGEIGDFTVIIRDVFKPTSTTTLRLRRKTILVDDHAYIEYSIDRGKSWVQLKHWTDTWWDTTWYLEQIDLSQHAGKEMMIRMRYSFAGGTYYGSNGGFWVDNVILYDVDRMTWTTIDDTISASASNYYVGVVYSGTKHYEVQAHDGTNWTLASPFVTLSVELDPSLDVDGDGLANGWEEAHYGSVTGAIAGADSDGDGADSLGEFVAGTDPFDSLSVFEVMDSVVSAGDPEVSWSSVSGKSYTIWRSTNLVEGFTAIATDVAATPPVNTYTDAGASSLGAVFYSIGVQE